MKKTSSRTGNKPTLLRFPKHFLWGTAAAAHQVEGNNHNSWTEWEKLPGKIVDGSRSGAACDHYRRYEKDFDDLKRLNHNTYRLSVEWSRLEPEPGKWNGRELDHYRSVLAALAKRGIEPMVTLHHFTNPVWFERMGAFEHDESPEIFARFAAKAAEELGRGVRLWCTINEPVVYAYEGYLSGIWPPGQSDFGLAVQVLRRLLRAHVLAYESLHRLLGPTVSVGIAKHFRIFDPFRPGHPGDRLAARINDFAFNKAFLIALSRGVLYPPLGARKRVRRYENTLDFIGVNYYTREMVRFDRRRGGAMFSELLTKPGAPRNSLGWEIYPVGLFRILSYCSRFGLPIYVTENGTTAADDAARREFIAAHLEAVHRAIRSGADVRGYYYWSNLDNFEWAEGYTARFGLIDVNYKTQNRTIRESGRFLAEVARRNALAYPIFYTPRRTRSARRGKEEERLKPEKGKTKRKK
jgi:beta-glucosidase